MSLVVDKVFLPRRLISCLILLKTLSIRLCSFELGLYCDKRISVKLLCNLALFPFLITAYKRAFSIKSFLCLIKHFQDMS